MRAAVVGHVEWIEFGRVDHMPAAGEIVHVSDSWQEPGGGGAVAAVQLARLADEATLYTALGDDELGHRCKRELEALGLRVAAVMRPEPQRRCFVHVDGAGERTITVIGDRLGPVGEDPLPWDQLDTTAAVYFCAGDAAAVRQARRARRLVSTARGIEVLREAGVRLDALVASRNDPGELYEPGDLDPPPDHIVRTAGREGGEFEERDGRSGGWEATPLPGSVSDQYGCGDSFAAGLTYGLGADLAIEAALALGARCGAACATGRGPFAGQLRSVG
jgi:ribokinase